MGYHNASLVTIWHGDLPGAAFKVLIRMALSTRDKDDPPHYRGGQGPLLLAIGRREVEPGDTSDAARCAREANQEALRAAIQPLRKRGLVTYAVTPVRGRVPEYWLHLEPSGACGQLGLDASKGQGKPAPRARESLAPNASKGQGKPAPRARESLAPEMKEQMKDLDEEEQRIGLPTLTTHLAREPPRIMKPVGVSDHGCIRGWLPDASGGRSADRCPACHPTTQEAS